MSNTNTYNTDNIDNIIENSLDDDPTDDIIPNGEKQISDLLLIIETCQTNVNNNFNIKLIAKYIKIDNILIGKKMCDYVEEGYINRKQKNAMLIAPTITEKDSDNNSYINNNAQGKKRQDFSNQMTIIVKKEKKMITVASHGSQRGQKAFDIALNNAILLNSENSNLNLKIFRTGSIIITGGLCQADCHYAVTEFLKRIGNIKEEYKLSNDNYEIEKMFGITSNIDIGDDKNEQGNQADVKDNSPLKTYVEFVYSHMQVLLYFFVQFGIDYDLNLDKIIESKSKKKISAFNSLVNKDSKDYYKYTRLVKCILTCNMYCSPETIKCMLNLTYSNDQKQNQKRPFIEGKHTLVYKFISDLYNGSNVILRSTLEPEIDFNFNVSCVNFNSKILCSFQINRSNLSDILNTQYVSFTKAISPKKDNKSKGAMGDGTSLNQSKGAMGDGTSLNQSKGTMGDSMSLNQSKGAMGDSMSLNQSKGTMGDSMSLNQSKGAMGDSMSPSMSLNQSKGAMGDGTSPKKKKVNNKNKLVENIKPLSLIQAEFNLNNYPGIKCSYITSDGKSIAILIFQSGKIIITGCNKWSQNCEGYQYIKDILLKHYDDIHYIDTITPEQTPNLNSIKKVIKFNDYVYINRDIYINKNPYNAKIAKEHMLYI